MCGLFGLLFEKTDLTTAQKAQAFSLFNRLAEESADRGTDATGMAVVRLDGTSTVYKDVQAAPDIVKTADWCSFLYNSLLNGNVKVLMGHTRWGTHGANIPANAHPFVMEAKHGTLVGTHNGVISNHEYLHPTKKSPFENDSANMFWAMSKLPDLDLPRFMEDVVGSFAVVMVRKNKLFMTRNKHNPLFLARVPGINAVAYASEKEMLGRAAQRAGVTIHRPASLRPHRMWCMDMVTGKETVAEYQPYDTSKLTSNNVSEDLQITLDMLESVMDEEDKPKKLTRKEKKQLKKMRRYTGGTVSV